MGIIRSNLSKPIRNNAELSKVLGDVTREAFSALTVEIERRWKEYIQANFYDQYEPSVYNRQYAILESMVRTDVVQNGNTMSAKVYIDVSKMNTMHPNSQGDWDGITVLNMIENVGMTLVNGVKRDPSYAYENTIDWLNKDFKTYLNSYGLQ